ncbi:MAG TPA: ShlB/FhaC/HecB family hemolysin secretion/activation protein [Sphingomonadaceae bacterium]|nr:ShlB/FhaC/HecB family hemolysin secretion/activation protein [Sphingomonadaceae bacterium]
MMRPFVCLLLSCVLAASTASAQSTSPLLIDRNRTDRAQPMPPLTVEPAIKQGVVSVAAEDEGQAAAPIRGIRFEGGPVPQRVARAAEAFLGKPARKAVIQQVAQAMAAAYAKTSVALYTVVVPAQDLGTGHLRILVAEGFIEGVTITGDIEDGPVALVKNYAARLTLEKPLTRATLERYLSLIRDIPGLTLDAKLLVGTRPGGVRLVLGLKQRGHDFAFGFNNRTTTLVGNGQFDASAKFYGLLREGDEADLAASSAIDFNEYRYISLSHSTPLGADGLRATLVGAYLTTRPRHSAIHGNAKLAGLTFSYPLIRSYKRNLTLSGGIDGLNSENAAFGSLIASERTRALRLAAGFSDQGPRHALSAGVTLSQGLDILGARVIAPLAETGFTKVNARAAIDRALGKKVVLRIRASGQTTRDRLPAAERFAVGGAEFGRAFDTAILNGDRGYAGLGELAWRPIAAKTLSGSELYAFVDGARVHIATRGLLPGGDFDLASAGGGVRFAWRDKATIELEAARSIDRPYAGYGDAWRFSLGWTLSLK